VAALDAALRAHLLEEDGAEGYRFAHGVIREVVEDDLGAARRALLHRRVAETLERALGAPPVEALAYHYGQSGVRDKAALYAEQAGDRAWAQFAHAAAEGHYRDAADHLDAQDRPHDAAGVREKLGAVLRTMGRYDAALTVLAQAEEAYRAAGDGEGLWRRSGGRMPPVGPQKRVWSASDRCWEIVRRGRPPLAWRRCMRRLHTYSASTAGIATNWRLSHKLQPTRGQWATTSFSPRPRVGAGSRSP